MRALLLPCLLVLCVAPAHSQSSTWDVHPLNSVPCTLWINPAEGCGGCSSCRVAIDTEPAVLDGGNLYWSDDLVLCPHPIDNQGHNVVLTTGWPLDPSPNTYVYGQVVVHQPLHIDTVEVICAHGNGGPDSIDIAVQFNTNDPLQTTTILQGALTNEFVSYTTTDLGCAPLLGAGYGWANIYLRAHGGDLGFLIKQLRVVASPCLSTSVHELRDEEVTILPVSGGVNITTQAPTDVLVCDAIGRVTYTRSAAAGTTFVPLSEGLSIVRVGSTAQRILR